MTLFASYGQHGPNVQGQLYNFAGCLMAIPDNSLASLGANTIVYLYELIRNMVKI